MNFAKPLLNGAIIALKRGGDQSHSAPTPFTVEADRGGRDADVNSRTGPSLNARLDRVP